jgi:hypothetical protein
MKCQKCGLDFPEAEIQLSHDVPKYIGGLDKDGRHNICKKCHDIYERQAFSIIANMLSEEERKSARLVIKRFSKRWFNETND